MIDVHAHLHDEAFIGDLDAVVDRARAVRIENIVTIGTDPEENRRAIACYETYPEVRVSVGLHPHFFNEREWQAEDLKLRIEELRERAKHPKVVAIGECGLDYFSHDPTVSITDDQKKIQREGFLAQISIAAEQGLPLIIHTRPSAGTMDAYEDVFLILKARPADEENRKAVILHCYMGDLAVTEKFLSLPDIFFSFTGNITYKAKDGSDRDATLRMIPIERMLSETDCPYLAPVPYRGKRNEPAYVAEVVRCIAEMKQMTYTETEERIGSNARAAFPRMFEIV